MGILHAYGDGSGPVAEVISVGMFLAEAQAWDAAEFEWKETAKRFNCYPFRMTDFVKAEKDHDRRTAVMTELVGVIHKTAMMGSVSVMHQIAYDSFLPTEATNRIGTPYLITATTALAMTAKWVRDMGYDDTILAIFETGDTGQKLYQDAINRIVASPLQKQREEWGVETVRFAPKGHAGLQMAEVLAWTNTHYVPELHFKDNFAQDVLAMIRERVCLQRKYVTKEFMLQTAFTLLPDDIRKAADEWGVKLPKNWYRPF